MIYFFYMKASDLLQQFISENSITLTLQTPQPVSIEDGSWLIKPAQLVVSNNEHGGQPKTESSDNAEGDGKKKS